MARTVGALLTRASSAAFTNTVWALQTAVATLSAFGWHLHLRRYCSSGAAKEAAGAAAKEEAAPTKVVASSRAEPRESPRSSLSGKKEHDRSPWWKVILELGASLLLISKSAAELSRVMMDVRTDVRSCNGRPSASDHDGDDCEEGTKSPRHGGEFERRLHEARITELEGKLKEMEREIAKLAARFTDSASFGGKESIDWAKAPNLPQSASGSPTAVSRGGSENAELEPGSERRTDDDKKRSSDAQRKEKEHARISSGTSSCLRAVSGDASKEHPAARPTRASWLRQKTALLRNNNSAKQTAGPPKRPRFLIRRASPEDLSRQVVLPNIVASRSSSERAPDSRRQAPNTCSPRYFRAKARKALDEEGAKERDGPAGDEEVKRDKFPGTLRARLARAFQQRIDDKLPGIMRARPARALQRRIDGDAKLAKMAPPQSTPDSAARKVVVLYVTSLRAIRKTYEDCRSTKSILQGYGVHVDERDLWMHEGFKDDLHAMLGAPARLPQVFADGKHLGGAEEIRRKHESGELSRALEACCKMAAPLEACAGCGSVRFVPCQDCSGSCKVFLEEVGGFQRCPKCNANGLVPCPLCSL